MRRLALVHALLLTLTACGNVYLATAPDPALERLTCPQQGVKVTSTLVLLAQAVPTASALPCVRSAPARWRLDDFDARDGIGHLSVTYGDEDDVNLVVDVVHRCDLEHATESPSDQPGMRRYDYVVYDTTQFSLDRYYVYRDACTAFHYTAGLGADAHEFAGEIIGALGFVERTVLDRHVRESTNGRLKLDPEPAP
jgi:hypothetical protein